MRHKTIFSMVLWQKSAAAAWLLKKTAHFADEAAMRVVLEPLLHEHGQSIHLRWLLHYEDYVTLLVKNKGLSGSMLTRHLPDLLAEQHYVETSQHLLIHFHSQRSGHLNVLAISRERLHAILPSWLTLNQCAAIDSYDYGLANAVAATRPTTREPMILLLHHEGLVRCLLLENNRLCAIQETTLLEDSHQTPSDQLIQRLSYYFSDYREKNLLIIGFDSAFSVSQLPPCWQFIRWETDITYLPLIGSGLRYAHTYTH